MTKARFIDDIRVEVIAKDGELFVLDSLVPILDENKPRIAQELANKFHENFSDDKSSMVYWVLMKMWGTFAFRYISSNRSVERERIGARIKQIREEKGIEAKHLALLANVDPGNLSKIEHGQFSVGLDVLSRIAHALGVRVDLV